jgi:serine protease Do
LSVAAALGVSAGLGLALRQNQVVGEEHNSTASITQAAHNDALGSTPAKTPEELKRDPVVQHANDLSRAFRESAKAAMPSVVTVYSHESGKKVKAERGENNGRSFSFGFGGENPFKGTPFEDKFKDMIPSTPEGGDFSFHSQPHDGMGTGVIIDRSGIILTNNHVVEGADTVKVRLSDGSEYTATDIKTDPHSDLAVVRIKANGDLPAAHLGDSDDLEIGDWVIAIGNPFNQLKTVTAGIISGKARHLNGDSGRTDYLQTDAAINPGNSGGPLVNLTGEVVGINTAIATNSGGYQGVGFAIPINKAKWVTEQLAKNGSVHRGYLGVRIGEVSSDLASQFGATVGQGALVAEVFPNTPAAEGKMQDGDVILKFAGHPVSGPGDLQEAVELSGVDKTQPVEVLRDGKKMTLNVTVKAMPEKYGMDERELTQKAPKAENTSTYNSDELGLQVSDMTADEAETYKGFEGVVVRKVDPNGLAAEKGLQPGMLIRMIGKPAIAVHNVKEFEAAAKKASLKDGVLMQVRTQSGNHFIVLQAQ